MRRLVSLWPAAFSAAMLLAAFAPLSLGLLTFVALAPFLAALATSSPRRGTALGYAFGFVFMAGQMAWLQPFVAKWTGSPILAAVPWLLTAFAGAWYFALFGWLAVKLYARGWHLAVPLVWAGVEVFRSYIPGLAFPWGLLGGPLWTFPAIAQSAYFGSVFLVSAWVLVSNQLLGHWLARRPMPKARPLLLAFAFVLALSLVRYTGEEPSKKRTITVGQLGIDMAFGDRDKEPGYIRASVANLFATARLNGSELLILPEGVGGDSEMVQPSPPFDLDPNVAVVFGGKWGKDRVYQTAYAYDGQWTSAEKTRLVIFGEYVPGRDWIPFLSAFELPSGDLSPGDKVETIRANDLKIGPLLCFEAMFPDLAYRQALNGVDLLAVLSIDDWYVGTPAPDQLRAGAVWRAIETGLPVVRSASLGYTMAADGKGRVLGEAPFGANVGLRVELPIPDDPKPFQLYPLFPALALASLGLPFIPKRRSRT